MLNDAPALRRPAHRRQSIAAIAAGFLLCCLAIDLYAADIGAADNAVHMLDYIAVDYPQFVREGRVVDEAEYREQQEFGGEVMERLHALPERPGKPLLLRDAERLRARIGARAPGAEVSALASRLRTALIATYDVIVSPAQPPDLGTAAALYASQCAGCHGANGHGDGPAGAGMDPPPSDFHDQARMASRSVHGLYSTISLGVPGTGMSAFRSLSENERWALAFHVASFATDAATAERGATLWRQGAFRPHFADLRAVTTQTRKEVAQAYGPEAAAVLGWLIAHPRVVHRAAPAPLARSRELVAASVAAYRRGEVDAAKQLAIAAYLVGFELAEASLSAVDPHLMEEIEGEMMAYRQRLRAGVPEGAIETQAKQLLSRLALAERRIDTHQLSPSTAALSAFVILLREGLEAILVVAAIAAFLVKAERREALRYVHLGWIGALVLGAATWFVARYLIEVSGAARELTEGATALFAAGILVYVGFWLHSKAYAGRWRQFIAAHLKGALSRGTVWALAGVSFLAVYRETFETVLFYQALWTQAGATAPASVLGGFVGAVVALAAVSWAVFRYGVKLPIGPFFGVSSALLAILAVVFVGQGVAALQEAGTVPADSVGMPGLPMLGVYPTVETLAAQAALAAVIIAGFIYSHRAARRPPRAAL
jgi:high-affinity iron transporter